MTGFLIWAVSLLVGGVAAYFHGRSRSAKGEAQSRADTLERALHADTGNPDGSDDKRWLQSRGERKRPDKRP